MVSNEWNRFKKKKMDSRFFFLSISKPNPSLSSQTSSNSSTSSYRNLTMMMWWWSKVEEKKIDDSLLDILCSSYLESTIIRFGFGEHMERKKIITSTPRERERERWSDDILLKSNRKIINIIMKSGWCWIWLTVNEVGMK